MEAELFGDMAEAKEAEAFASKYKEAKVTKAYDTYQLLASLITFDTHLETLLLPVHDRLHQATEPKVSTPPFYLHATPCACTCLVHFLSTS